MNKKIIDVQPIRSKEGLDNIKWSLRRFCSERDYILFLIGINTGLRVGDLVKLQVSDVRRKKRAVIREGKTNKSRTIYMDNIYKEVQEYLKTVNSPWLFPSRKGDKHITPTQAYRQIQKAAKMADLESIGTHTMRKTFGYWHYRQFRDVVELQTILNHSTPSVTLRYIGITEEAIENNLKTFKL